ncbi:Hypothetical protein, putative [Bodo saltans]|uniref:Uncharacterized protein n=1 Tax=Bodo saltans TaxID=75058 RepID=A0A0S4KLS1_BODSA|nr:Hypothetical protein, putative [Bodo saltans]|eukprot:CUI15562.1 Hypothetical protein, putative [Bodo saltans]
MDLCDIIRLQSFDRELENLLEGVVRRQAAVPLIIPRHLREYLSSSDHSLQPPPSSEELAVHSGPSSSNSSPEVHRDTSTTSSTTTMMMMMASCLLSQSGLEAHLERTHNSPGYVVIQHELGAASNKVCLLFCSAGHLMFGTRRKPAGSVCVWCGWKLNTNLSIKEQSRTGCRSGGVVGWCVVCASYICIACKEELLEVQVPAVWSGNDRELLP